MLRPTSDHLLRSTAGVLWVAAVAVGLAAVWVPYRSTAADPEPVVVPASRPATGPTTERSFDDVIDVVLRRPLVDPPATTTAAPVTPAVPVGPPVRLAGIVTEPGHTVAVFLTPTGGTDIRGVGGRTAGVEVVAISPTAVTVRYNGQLTTLSLPPRRAD